MQISDIMKKSIQIFVTLLVATFFALSLGFTKSKTKSQSKLKSTSKSKISKKLKRVRKKKKSLYSGAISSSLTQGLEEKDRPTGGLGLKVSRAFSKKVALSGEVSFYNAFDEFEDPHIRGFEDMELTLSNSSLAGSKAHRVNLAGFVGAVLPLSETSREASLRGGGFTGVSLSKKFDRFSISYTPVAVFMNHEFETADVKGFQPNFKTVGANSIGITFTAHKRVSWSNSYKYSSLWDYGSRQTDVQQFVSSISVEFTKKLSAAFTYKQKDKVLSNHSLFDQENTTVSIGIEYTL